MVGAITLLHNGKSKVHVHEDGCGKLTMKVLTLKKRAPTARSFLKTRRFLLGLGFSVPSQFLLQYPRLLDLLHRNHPFC